MQTFTEYLEEAIKFALARDNDYFYDEFSIVTFSKDDIKNYRLEGKTHGLYSHACKHLIEVDEPFVNTVVAQIKNTMVDYVENDNHPKEYEFNLYKNSNRPLKGLPSKMVNTAPREAIINFLDLVNDKIMLREKLSPIEAKMKKYLDKLAKRYSQVIESYVSNAQDITKTPYQTEVEEILHSAPTVTFIYQPKHGYENRIYLNFANNFIIMKLGGTYTTGYKISGNINSRRDLVRAFLRKFVDNGKGSLFKSHIVYSAMKDFANPSRR